MSLLIYICQWHIYNEHPLVPENMHAPGGGGGGAGGAGGAGGGAGLHRFDVLNMT